MGIQYIATLTIPLRLLDKLALNTLHEVVLPIYPKAPEYHLEDTYNAIKEVYDELVAEVGVDHIVIMGDGSGGGLAMRFVQSLIEENEPVPSKLFLISPLLDATLSNKNDYRRLRRRRYISKSIWCE